MAPSRPAAPPRPRRGISLARLIALLVMLMVGMSAGRLVADAGPTYEDGLRAAAAAFEASLASGQPGGEEQLAALDRVLGALSRVTSPVRQERALGRAESLDAETAMRLDLVQRAAPFSADARFRRWSYEGSGEAGRTFQADIIACDDGGRAACMAEARLVSPGAPPLSLPMPSLYATIGPDIDPDDAFAVIAPAIGAIVASLAWAVAWIAGFPGAWLRRRRAA